MNKLLLEKVSDLSIELSEKQVDQFIKFYELLVEWNKVMNLTGITEYEDVVEKHFIDSLSLVKTLDIMDIETVIDIGTGAGFPGIPLKIVRKDIKLTLLDSLNKRLVFLDNVKRFLELESTKIVHGRAEDAGKDTNYREKYDIATARAVANLSVLAEYCLPFVKVGGLFVCMKGNNVEEIEEAEKALDKLGGKIEKIEKIYLPNSDIERNIVIIRKIKSTPKEFPRKAGVPSKNPIK